MDHRLYAHRLQQLQYRDSVNVAHGPQSTGSTVVAHGLSCSEACGIFLDQRSNPWSPAMVGRFLCSIPPGKSSKVLKEANAKRFQLYQTSFTRNVQGTSLSKKEMATTRSLKTMKEKSSLVKSNIH